MATTTAGTIETNAAAQEHYREVATGVRKGQCAFDLSSSGYTDADLDGIPGELCSISQGCSSISALGKLNPGATVVDVGSGAGLDLFVARKRVGQTGRVIGIEPVAEMRETCQKFIDESGYPNVEVREGSASQIPVESGTVDCVLSNCVLSLLNDDNAMAEIHRVLRPGSRFVFSDNFIRGQFLWVFALVKLFFGKKIPMLRQAQLSRRHRMRSLKKAGFAKVEILKSSTYSADEVKNLVTETGLPSSLTFLARIILFRGELAATKAG